MAGLKTKLTPRSAEALSARERELIQLVCCGHSTKKAAAIMGISVKTAETHRNNAMGKLALGNAVRLTHWAIGNGLVQIMTFGDAPVREEKAPRSLGLESKKNAGPNGVPLVRRGRPAMKPPGDPSTNSRRGDSGRAGIFDMR